MSDKVQPGRYNAVAIKFDTDEGPAYAQFGESSKGTKQVLMQFRILDGDFAGEVLPWFGYFTTKTVDNTLKAMRVCGMKGEDLYSLWGANAQELNQQVSIVTELNTNPENGKTHARVAWVNSPGGGNGIKLKAPMAKDDMRKFAAQMKSRVKAIPEVSAPVFADDVAPTPPPQDAGDDLPF